MKNPYGEPQPAEPTPSPPVQTQSAQHPPHVNNVASPISAQSLAGDWEYSLNGPQKLVLHLRMGPGGALVGSVDTSDTPPKHIELSNIQLTDRVLKYTWPGLGTLMEVVNADGNGMIGAQIWVRPNTAAISPGDVAGDWEPSDTLRVGRVTAILRLRLGSSGSLTGAMETPLAIPPQRIKLEDVQISGKTITYKLATGNTFRGTFSNDRQAIIGDQGGPSWQHVRTLAQALAEDAKEKPLPTDGTWRGVIEHVEWSDMMKPPYPQSGLYFLLRFNSAPESCAGSVHLSAEFAPSDMTPCAMKLDGSRVQAIGGYVGVITGTLSGTQLTGTWTPADSAYFAPYAKVPMKLTLTREATPQATH